MKKGNAMIEYLVILVATLTIVLFLIEIITKLEDYQYLYIDTISRPSY